MKKGLLVLVALSIALLMGASMLVAQEKASAGMEKGTCKKEMKLTDEQKTKIEEMKMNFRLKMIDLKAEQEKLGITLKKEMMKPEPAMKDIEVVVKKMSAVREQIQLASDRAYARHAEAPRSGCVQGHARRNGHGVRNGGHARDVVLRRGRGLHDDARGRMRHGRKGWNAGQAHDADTDGSPRMRHGKGCRA